MKNCIFCLISDLCTKKPNNYNYLVTEKDCFVGATDNVNHPSHYQGKVEVIDYITDKLSQEEFEGYLVGDVIKYISRYKKKNGLEDLKKCAWYLNKLIEVMEDKKK